MRTAMNARIGRLFLNTTEWKKITIEGKSFVSKLLKVDPNQRMDTAAAFEHIWVSKYRTRLDQVYNNKQVAEWKSQQVK